MKFLVTGGAGFIGHNVVRQLEAMGHSCFIIDNFNDYGFINQEELKYLYQARMSRMNAVVHKVDLCDYVRTEDWFRTFCFGASAVIHLASFPRQKVVSMNPVKGSEVMSTALVNLLELTRKFGVHKFLYVSSSMVYGNFNHGVKEYEKCEPEGQYGIMKYMGEKLVQDYTRRGCFGTSIVRPSAVYGEWDVEDRVVSKFMLGALLGEEITVKGESEVLDFTHVEDTARGIALAAVSTCNDTYNITRSSEKLCTLADAANMIVQIAGKGSVKLAERDSSFPNRGRLDVTLARRRLGFTPTIDIEDGFERYYNWFKNSEYWKNKI